MQLGEPPLYKIAKNIEKIQKDIYRLSNEMPEPAFKLQDEV